MQLKIVFECQTIEKRNKCPCSLMKKCEEIQVLAVTSVINSIWNTDVSFDAENS